MTKVFLASFILDIMIWIPARIMKHAANTRLAPMIGVGIMTKIAASFGKKAMKIKINVKAGTESYGPFAYGNGPVGTPTP